MRQAGEPSVEEILASIKKVIARDNRLDAPRRDTGWQSSGDTLVRDRISDVLDLGEVAAQIWPPNARHLPAKRPSGARPPLLRWRRTKTWPISRDRAAAMKKPPNRC
jgi:hypothetical protein